MTGNEAIAEAAIMAGCDFYAGYPITPQNELIAYMAKKMPELGRPFVQAESEIAAINMVFGASAAGARAMTSSSSPGISLKQEGISYLAGAELPAVIVNIMRGGPGLGNIAPAQSDYFQAVKGGGHGDYHTIVLAPHSVQEAYDIMQLAFDLADEYRNPVMILGDGILGQMMEPIKIKNEKLKIKNYKFVNLNNVNKKNFKFGKISAEYGRASMEYLNKALEMLKNKELDCLITCPISKEAINLAGYKYSGHTEYLSERANTKNTVMMLLNNKLKTSLVTRHIPLKDVSGALSQEKIENTILTTYESLKKLFFIKNPKIAVCGLNPHASDNGLIGDEENKVIIPALNKLRGKIKQLYGPIPADTAIAKTMLKQYDCVIAMYHDQSLIPLKLSGAGVNITLGLPIIRTSPLHGTAFDIAGKNQADCASLNEAIKLAIQCSLNLKNA